MRRSGAALLGLCFSPSRCSTPSCCSGSLSWCCPGRRHADRDVLRGLASLRRIWAGTGARAGGGRTASLRAFAAPLTTGPGSGTLASRDRPPAVPVAAVAWAAPGQATWSATPRLVPPHRGPSRSAVPCSSPSSASPCRPAVRRRARGLAAVRRPHRGVRRPRRPASARAAPSPRWRWCPRVAAETGTGAACCASPVRLAAVDLDDAARARRRSRQLAARARGRDRRLAVAVGVSVALVASALVSTRRAGAEPLPRRMPATTSRACARPCSDDPRQRALRLTRPGGRHQPPVRQPRPGVGRHRAGSSRRPVFDVPSSRLRVVGTPEGRLADPALR